MTTPPLEPFRIEGGFVFTSGQIGLDRNGTAPSSTARQVEIGIDALAAVLERAGASLDDVVKTLVVIVDRDDFAAMNEVYAERFSPPYPTRTTIVSDLVLPSLRFEIEAVARLGGRHGGDRTQAPANPGSER